MLVIIIVVVVVLWLSDASLECGTESGIVFAVPIPADASCIGNQIERAIQLALQEAKSRGIQGKEITPFVLGRVNEVTKGKSLQASILCHVMGYILHLCA